MLLKNLIRVKRRIVTSDRRIFEVTYSPLTKRIRINCSNVSGLAYLTEIGKVMKDFNLPKLEETIMSSTYKGDKNDFEAILNKIEGMN